MSLIWSLVIGLIVLASQVTSQQLDETIVEFNKNVVDRINYYRAKHGARPLEFSSKMAGFAETVALKYANDIKLEETLYGICSDGFSLDVPLRAETVVDKWYKDGALFVYGEEKQDPKTSCFSQILWKSSENFGINVIKSANQYVAVALFYPKGNIQGQYSKNVLTESSSLEITTQEVVEQNTRATKPVRRIQVTKPSAVSVTTYDPFESKALKMNNHYRLLHGLQNLMIDQVLVKKAQIIANHLAIDESVDLNSFYTKNKIVPPGSKTRVVNNAMAGVIANKFEGSDKLYGDIAIKSIYKNSAGTYNYEEENNPDSDSFTQIMWKSSKKVGYAISSNEQYSYFVALFSPPGNIPGMFLENVYKNIEPLEEC